MKIFSLPFVALFAFPCAVFANVPADISPGVPVGKISGEAVPARRISRDEILRDAAVWSKTVPAEIARNYLFPETSVGEDRDDWRPLFRQKFLPLVKNCGTATDAAETLNREIWEILGVKYSPGRDKPDQSPFHSMRIGKASCTGLSILLIDACRAVGVPARFVGCVWKNKPGNHSWVEIWDGGEWKHLGAGDGGRAGEAWFDADAAAADSADPRYAIYAACVDPTGLAFPFAWEKNPDSPDIPAINVTARYALASKKLPPEHGRVSVDLRSRDGERLRREIVILDVAGMELFRGMTHDAGFDLNDHVNFTFPRGTEIKIVSAENPRVVLAEFCVPVGEKMLTIVAD